MSVKELQEDEREALSSIYEGDELYKEIDSQTYQYKVGLSRMFELNKFNFIILFV